MTQSINIGARMVLVNPSNANNLQTNNIAYISCDSTAYTGPIDASKTINLAVERSPVAIVLYSTVSTRCAFRPTDGFMYDVIYTMPDANTSMVLEKGLAINSPPAGVTNIRLAQQSTNNGNGGDVVGKSPSTAVAMIILYSITGIITALFLIIIVVGALRAHRHPERYGPRNVVGRARQSRARGIARAMLETLPIVKFGERDHQKPVERAGIASQDRGAQPNPDVELGTIENRDHPTSPTATINPSHPATTPDPTSTTSPTTPLETVTTETHPGTSPSQPSDNPNADNGLACSVCTDDFVKGQDIRVLPCNHKFHPDCIDPWLLNVSGTCPLCRVDLRPTKSQTSNNEELGDMPSAQHETGPAGSLAEHRPSTNRRSRTGLGSYLHHTLNIHRMRDATPQERIAALRDVRSQQQNPHPHPQQPPADPSASERQPGARTRISARWSRALHPGRQAERPPQSSLETAPARERQSEGSVGRAMNEM